MTERRYLSLAIACAIALLLPALVFAQAAVTTLAGRVTDAQDAAASGATPGAQCAVADSAAGIVRTMDRLHAGRALRMTVDVPRDHVARIERPDLDEILGNLVDNACKWARHQVAVGSSICHDRVAVTIDDDGAGIPETMRDVVMQRGVRLDEAAPGSGFGLAIVRDLVEIYGGSFALDHSPLGGTRAVVHLPRP